MRVEPVLLLRRKLDPGQLRRLAPARPAPPLVDALDAFRRQRGQRGVQNGNQLRQIPAHPDGAHGSRSPHDALDLEIRHQFAGDQPRGRRPVSDIGVRAARGDRRQRLAGGAKFQHLDSRMNLAEMARRGGSGLDRHRPALQAFERIEVILPFAADDHIRDMRIRPGGEDVRSVRRRERKIHPRFQPARPHRLVQGRLRAGHHFDAAIQPFIQQPDEIRADAAELSGIVRVVHGRAVVRNADADFGVRLQPRPVPGVKPERPAHVAGQGEPFGPDGLALRPENLAQRAIQQGRQRGPVLADAERQIPRRLLQAPLQMQIAQHFLFKEDQRHRPVSDIGHGLAAGHRVERLPRVVIRTDFHLGQLLPEPRLGADVPLQRHRASREHFRRAVETGIPLPHDDLRDFQIGPRREEGIFAPGPRRHLHQAVQFAGGELSEILVEGRRMDSQNSAQQPVHLGEQIRADAGRGAGPVREIDRGPIGHDANVNFGMVRQNGLLRGRQRERLVRSGPDGDATQPADQPREPFHLRQNSHEHENTRSSERKPAYFGERGRNRERRKGMFRV